jgi:protein-tyrosine phosphatase
MRRKTVLFLCTGNYYRSRFAELLFNYLASQKGLDWPAMSRALAIELGRGNIGPISPAVVREVRSRAIPLEDALRFPLGLGESDLAGASHIVAVDQDEHLPLLERKFPSWVDRVEFWNVHDMHLTLPSEAFAEIDQDVLRLIERLGTMKQAGRHVGASMD